MITDIAELRTALRRKAFSGVILYAGGSALDGAPVVAIATGIVGKSHNAKTGAMVQTWILRSDMAPLEALRNGGDSSICGDCKHRYRIDSDGKRKRSCYVNVGQAPRQIFVSYKAGRYAVPGVDYAVSLLPELFEGLEVRLGSYGDPTVVPFQIWRAVTLRCAGKTGYTHQWRDPRFAAFKLLCMASADGAQDAFDAVKAGWRYFRVRGASEQLGAREFACPASAEMGHKTSCDTCKACGGLSAKAKANPVIIAHGATAVHFATAA